MTCGTWEAALLHVDGPDRIYVSFNPDREGDATTGHLVRLTVPRGLPNPDGHPWLAAREGYTSVGGDCADTCRDRIPDDDGWLKLTPGR